MSERTKKKAGLYREAFKKLSSSTTTTGTSNFDNKKLADHWTTIDCPFASSSGHADRTVEIEVVPSSYKALLNEKTMTVALVSASN